MILLWFLAVRSGQENVYVKWPVCLFRAKNTTTNGLELIGDLRDAHSNCTLCEFQKILAFTPQ